MKVSFPTESVRIGYAYPSSTLGGASGAYVVWCGDDCREFPTVFPVYLAASSYRDEVKTDAKTAALGLAVEYALSIERPVDASFVEMDFGLDPKAADPWRSRGVVHSLDNFKAGTKGGAL